MNIKNGQVACWHTHPITRESAGSIPALTTNRLNIMQEDLYGVPDNGVDDVETTPRNNYGQVEED